MLAASHRYSCFWCIYFFNFSCFHISLSWVEGCFNKLEWKGPRKAPSTKFGTVFISPALQAEDPCRLGVNFGPFFRCYDCCCGCFRARQVTPKCKWMRQISESAVVRFFVYFSPFRRFSSFAAVNNFFFSEIIRFINECSQRSSQMSAFF